jgi:SNF2 family DNA or RNA helicase
MRHSEFSGKNGVDDSYIKTASTVASRAACAVDADRRIALTGTPIQNKIEDIWALFKFLRLKPIDEKEQFTRYISAPCKIGNQVGVARLQLVMRCCTLRRTKDSTADDGRKILNLPMRKESQMWLELREDERAIYDARHAQGKAELDKFQQNEVGTRNYAHVLQQILRLRQTCNHVDLAQMDPVEEDYDGTIMDYEVAVNGINVHGLNQNRGVSVVCFMKDGEGANCAECNYDYNDYFPSLALTGIEETKPKKKMPTPLLLTKCLHIYCEFLPLSLILPWLPRFVMVSHITDADLQVPNVSKALFIPAGPNG